jgi:tetratricopeptide (TPR) repeat protein
MERGIYAASSADPYMSKMGNMLVGIAFSKMRNKADALAILKDITARNPASPQAQYYKALTQLELGQYEDVVVSTTSAITLKPDFSEAYSLRGRAREMLNQPDAANLDYAAATRLKPTGVLSQDFVLWDPDNENPSASAHVDATRRMSAVVLEQSQTQTSAQTLQAPTSFSGMPAFRAPSPYEPSGTGIPPNAITGVLFAIIVAFPLLRRVMRFIRRRSY